MGLLHSFVNKIVKRIPPISRLAAAGAVLLVAILTVTACGGQDTSQPVRATWIKPQVTGSSVSFPVGEVNNNKIVHFNVATALGSEMAFMAYEIDGKLNVRANVCPPCRSIGFSLSKDTLVCDTCRTTFDAKTGDGIAGACVNYPKASVAYDINNGQVVMKDNDLVTAYQNTIEPGWE